MAYDHQQPMAPPRGRHRLPRWLVFLAVGWAALLLVLAYGVGGRTPATVREQSAIDATRPYVSRAVAELVRAGGDAVAMVDPLTRVHGCSISPGRGGGVWQQIVWLYTAEHAEPALLDRLAARLPAAYQARATHGGGGRVHSLRADAGDFVGITGSVSGPGEVRLVVATGCRPGSLPDDEMDATAEPSAAAVFAALGLTPQSWRTHEVPCPGGGTLRVVTARSDAGVPPSLSPDRLGPNLGSVSARPELLAYRIGATSVVARVRDGVLTVTSTMDCPS